MLLIEKVKVLCDSAVMQANYKQDVLEDIFSRLDDLIMLADEEQVRSILEMPSIQSLIPELHRIRAIYEYNREKELAIRFLEEPGYKDSFRSSEWYDLMHEFELKVISQKKFSNLLFAGCGCFPMTPIFLANYTGANVECFDIEPEACELAQSIVEVMEVSNKVKIFQSDILDFIDFNNYDLVFIATIVGVTEEEKNKIHSHLQRYFPSNKQLILRTSVGRGRLIYPEINLSELEGFKLHYIENPPNKLVTIIEAHK